VKSLLRRRPTPAMIIALIALFVSLSGVSYGVVTGFIDSREIKNNEVRSIDIRNNEVRTRDLRNNEVRGIDIRNSTVQGRDVGLNTITGEDVKEETLQKVPSALLADTATKATSADSAGSVSTLKVIPRTTLAEDATPVTLATHGPLTVRAKCTSGATNTRAEVWIGTSEDKSAAGGTGFQHPDLDSGSEEKIAEVDDAAGGDRSIGITDAYASAPSGKAFTGQVALYGDSAAEICTFYGHLALAG
jgi:hypothetical protein